MPAQDAIRNKILATLELAHDALRAVDASNPTIPQTEETMDLISAAVDAVERMVREMKERI